MFVLGPKLKRSLGLDQVQDLTEETETPDLVPDDWREMGRVEGEAWGAIGAERRPAAARLIYRKGLKEGEPWPVVVRRLARLRDDRRDFEPGGMRHPVMVLRRLLAGVKL